MHARRELLEIGHHRVAVDVTEGESPLLLLNGVGGGRAMWEPLREQLPPGIATIAYDAPGCGASPPANAPLSIHDQARIAAGVLARLGVARADVLGFSFGGMVAQQLARDVPGAVRRLVLVATGVGVGSVPGSALAYALLTLPQMADPNWMRSAAPHLFGGRLARRPADLERYARRYAQPVHPASYAGQLQAALLWSSLPWLSRLRAPALVLTGGEDPLVPVCNATLLGALLPQARVHVVRGAGHLLLLEAAAEAAAAIGGFLGPERAGSARR
ncbi:pimeloyl-ACP methyl ester carboxylesterase [Kineococcus xinjiangensis]|uniref:Pimeloyl-ACP methyl ester carboxylesterase n=1 Tax=Kineococcus xinjiangensis TaxID=512762 RepID=A0A2S6IDP4_9ACTN|nr:alpha/beta hydrolase [Kineococcus xinjiangensis]PPK92306.1 pimeloyl-ACP methyl ester carboxylesterase [Kineococcus xinjiangensis]